MIEAKDGEVKFGGVKDIVMAEVVVILWMLKKSVSEKEYKAVIEFVDKHSQQIEAEIESMKKALN